MNQVEIRFSALLSNEAFARTAIAAFCAQLNPSMEELVEIKTLVSEAVSNAIIHGYKMDGSRDVYVNANITNKMVEIVVQDYGVGIEDIELAMQPNFSSLKNKEHSGMGFTIMQTLADDLQIRSVYGLGTKVIIKKKLMPVELEEVM
ncbi:TPA: anti-sigma F factor [bacterium]|jgi:stage II sporulation protein AB (anti-sigma F factor)|nr:anti-sigma F factor [bacterium]